MRRDLRIVARCCLVTRTLSWSLFTGGRCKDGVVGSVGAGLVTVFAICAYDACKGLGVGAGVLVGVCFAADFRASQSDMICWLMVAIFAL